MTDPFTRYRADFPVPEKTTYLISNSLGVGSAIQGITPQNGEFVALPYTVINRSDETWIAKLPN